MPESPTAKKYRPGGSTTFDMQPMTLIQGRYKVSSDQVIGAGSFATVYKGMDMKELSNVAVKVYNSNEASHFESFMKSVEVLGRLHSGGQKRITDKDLEAMTNTQSFKLCGLTKDLETPSVEFENKVMEQSPFEECFVRILSYSQDAFGNPGMDIATETYFIVFELGEASLEGVLADNKEAGISFSIDELRALHWSLVSIVCGLHSEGYCHLDIKPNNIVRFQPEKGRKGGTPIWKLIDLDGAVLAGQEVRVSEIVYTPLYMAPELASVFAGKGASRKPVKTSRLMDVWSVGMCAMEAIFLTPILEPWYKEWSSETGQDAKFMEWLADMGSEPIVSGPMQEALNDLDTDMCRFLRGMLAKDPKRRLCITDCINHTWLMPIRSEIVASINEMVGEAMSRKRGKPAGGRKEGPSATGDAEDSSPLTPQRERRRSRTNFHAWSWSSEETEEEQGGVMGHISTGRAKMVASGVQTRACAVM